MLGMYATLDIRSFEAGRDQHQPLSPAWRLCFTFVGLPRARNRSGDPASGPDGKLAKPGLLITRAKAIIVLTEGRTRPSGLLWALLGR